MDGFVDTLILMSKLYEYNKLFLTFFSVFDTF